MDDFEISPEQETANGKLELEKDDLERLMGEKWGRRFVWRQLSRAGVFRQSFQGDANWTFFNEGRRSAGLMLLADINETCPEQYGRMAAENNGQ